MQLGFFGVGIHQLITWDPSLIFWGFLGHTNPIISLSGASKRGFGFWTYAEDPCGGLVCLSEVKLTSKTTKCLSDLVSA